MDVDRIGKDANGNNTNGMKEPLLILITTLPQPYDLLWEVVLLSHMTVRPEEEIKYHATLVVKCAQLLQPRLQ